MDLVTTAIVTALTDDVAAGLAKGGENAIAAAYDTLKAVIKEKFGIDSSLIEAVQLFEKKPDSIARQEVLMEEVTMVEAERIAEVIAAAQNLLDKINRAHQADAAGIEADPIVPLHLPLQRPTRTDHFTGRETELDQLLTSLQPGRIVNLNGPSGVGKSALAAKAIWKLAPDDEPPSLFPDGIIYHNFYRRPQGSLALEEIATAFGEEIGATLQEAARRALAGRHVLLLLDEAEHADDLSQVLTVCDTCGVLIVSRESTDIAHEQYDIGPLSIEEAMNLFELEAWGWVRKSDKGIVQEVCELVGGLPLSVRLAGRYLTTGKQNISGFLEWLQGTSLPALDQSQRCIESVPLLLQRSLSDVNELARHALAVTGFLALAPFGQDIVADAMAKGAPRGLFGTVQKLFKQKPQEEIPELTLALDQLVNYGILQWVGRGYEISHSLIHAYAKQRLMAPAKVIERLVAYYTNLVGEQILLGLDGYARLDAERPHLMAVLSRSLEQEDWESAHNLAAAIEDYLDLQGYWTERVLTNEAGLMAAQKLGRWNEGSWLGNLGLTYSNGGQPERAIEYYEQALAIARKNQDQRSEGNWLGNLGLAYRDLEQIDKARQYLEQSVAIFEAINSPTADLIRDWLEEFKDE